MPLLERVKKIVKSRDRGEAQRKSSEIEGDGSREPHEKQTNKKNRPGKEKASFVKLDIGRADRVISSPLISEKATNLLSQGQYVFKVKTQTNKVEVRKAVAQLYGVTVTGIRMITIHRKKRRLRRSQGYRAGYKKAIVRVKKGEKIEALSQ